MIMKGLCVYIKAGKGHYVPAKAVNEQLEKLGVDSQLVDFFGYLNLNWMERINQEVWRMMLRIPFLEKHLFSTLDKSGWGIDILIKAVRLFGKKKLLRNIEEFRPDFIFATHPYPGTILSTLLSDLNIDIPVYFYSTDVFSAPAVSICPHLRKFLIPTEEGRERVIAMGQDEKSVEICPFPLQASVAEQPRLSKKDARRKLGINEEKFTLQLNLGGEGLGSLNLLEDILREDLPVQIVIIGGIKKEMQNKLNRIVRTSTARNAEVIIRGFIDNVSDYLAASDVIAGRAGINTIVEAIYAHRPFLITELVYIVIDSAEYIEKHHVGWNAADDREKQLAIIKELAGNPDKLEAMDACFDDVPIEYSAEKLAEMIIADAKME